MQPISSLLKRDLTPAPSVSEPLSDDVRENPPILVAQGRDPATGPRFSPTARLVINPSLRTSGLLMELSDEAAKTLLSVITFLTPDGRLQATVTQVAAALRVSDKTARDRIMRLSAITWQGKPIAFLLPRESGMDGIVLSPHLVSYEEEGTEAPIVGPTIPTAGRSAVMERSRALYARPRAEVERMVMEQLGYPTSEAEDTLDRQVRRSLNAFGLSQDEIEDLIARFPIEKIERQIAWMGFRKAKSPKRYLMAAIEGDYDAPVEVRKSAKTIEDISALYAMDENPKPHESSINDTNANP